MGAWYTDYTVKGGNETYVRRKFSELQKNAAYEHGSSYSGEINMAHGLEFTGKIFKSYLEASEYISETAEKFGAALVVQYRNNAGQLVWLIGGLFSC
jgi:hypothetical protein